MEERDGWVKLHRRLLKWPWFKNGNILRFFIYCLLKSTHQVYEETVGFQKVILQPGQFIFGRKKAAQETGLSNKSIRTCTTLLEKENCIKSATHTSNHFSIITILNWDTYQTTENEKGQPSGQLVASQGPASGQLVASKRPQTRTIRTIRTEEQEEHQEGGASGNSDQPVGVKADGGQEATGLPVLGITKGPPVVAPATVRPEDLVIAQAFTTLRQRYDSEQLLAIDRLIGQYTINLRQQNGLLRDVSVYSVTAVASGFEDFVNAGCPASQPIRDAIGFVVVAARDEAMFGQKCLKENFNDEGSDLPPLASLVNHSPEIHFNGITKPPGEAGGTETRAGDSGRPAAVSGVPELPY
jgi:hypothetical protein